MLLLRTVSASVALLQHKAVFMICAVTKDSVQAHDPDSQEQGCFFPPVVWGWLQMHSREGGMGKASLTTAINPSPHPPSSLDRKPPENSQNAPGSTSFLCFSF